MFAEYSLCVGTFLEADSMVRNKAGNVPDFIYLLSTCIRAYSMRETVLGTLQMLNHLIFLTMLWGWVLLSLFCRCKEGGSKSPGWKVTEPGLNTGGELFTTLCGHSVSLIS